MTTIRSLGPALRRAACLLAASAALCGPAQAAFVQGDWDPPFGEPFPQLGWRGSASFEVPAACLVLSGTVLNTGGACPTISLLSAEVEFYDIAAPATTVETLDFAGFVALSRIEVDDGLVQGFTLVSTGLVPSTSPLGLTVPGGEQAAFGLDIDYVIGGDTIAVLSWAENVGNPREGRNDPAFPAIVRITQTADPVAVPVPATLGLALAGLALLAALTATGRRTRR